MLDIKRGNATILSVNATGEFTEKIMDSNIVDVEFTLTAPFAFLIGDYIVFEGKQFFLNSLPEYQLIESRQINYTLQFQSENYELAKVQYQSLDAGNKLMAADFALMANALIFMQLLVQNMNRAQSGWVLGDVDDTDFRNLTFSNENCSQVLSNLAIEFQTEYWIDGKTIHLSKRTIDTGLVLQYGQGNGLCDISRKNVTDKQLFTRLYVLGGTQNIPGDYRNYSTRLKMPIATGDYLEKNVAKYGLIESTITFEDIYPKREGTVSSVVAGNDNWRYFTDGSLDFDVNSVLIPGTSAKVVFNTGQLAGYTFEINSYNAATKQFSINKNTDEKSIDVPSSLLRPVVGDKYVLVDVLMPQSYVTNAENDLQAAGQDELNQNCDPRVTYSGLPNRMFYKSTGVALQVGSLVTIKNGPLGIDDQVRIVSLTRDINDLYNYTSMDLSESVSPAPIVRQYAEQEKVSKAIKINNLLDPMRARNNWRTTQEALALVFDPEGNYYTDKIKPLSIETTLLSVGSRPQQFELSNVVIDPNFQSSPSKLRISAGTIVHFTIDNDRIRTWGLAAYANDGVANNAYYIYAKCNKTNDNDGTFLVTTAQILVDQDATYYHFLIGILHTPINGVRSVSFSYGQTTVNGKFVTAGRVQSQDGLTYFDLDTGEISGKIIFKSVDGSLKPVSSVDTAASNAQSSATNAQTSANAANAAAVIAQNNAASASTAANNAQTAANTANALLSDIANDNKLTPSEKQDTLNEWNIIQGEKNTIDTQATGYGLSTAAYDTAYNALYAYITPLLSNLNSTDSIDGPTFRNTFLAYYNARQILLKSISDKAKVLADSAQTTANTAVSNAATALTNANNAQTSANAANALLADIASDSKLTAVEKQQVYTEYSNINAEVSTIVNQAGTYGLDATSYQSYFSVLTSYLTPLLSNLASTSDIVPATFRGNFANYYSSRQQLLKAISDTAKNLAAAAQSTANNASSSAASAQATANSAKGVTDNFTSIDGGLITSNTVKLGTQQTTTAGITGVTADGNNSVMLWTGSTFENRNSAPFRVLLDGRVYMSNAYISGEIHATSGYIGGLNVGDGVNLVGNRVQIYPDKGVSIQGFLTVPTGFSSDPLTNNKWQIFVDESGVGGGGTGTPSGGSGASRLVDLTDVSIPGVTNGQFLQYNASLGKWVNANISVNVDLSNYYTKSQSDSRYLIASASVQPVGNTVVIRDQSGYISNNYINTTDDVQSNNLQYIVGKINGDNYHRSFTSGAVKLFLGVPAAASLLYDGYTANSSVSGLFSGIYEGASYDPYGYLSVCLPAYGNTPGYFGMTRAGQIGWMMGIDQYNAFVIGTGTPRSISSNKVRIDTFGSLFAGALLTADRLAVGGYDSGVSGSVSSANWFRSYGDSGWYSSTYGGGIYMSDSSWVRVYNNKGLIVNNTIYASNQVWCGTGFKCLSSYGMVGNYDVQSNTNMIIWTIGDQWNSISGMYGLSYGYGQVWGGHEIQIRNAGQINISMDMNGYLWARQYIKAPTIEASNALLIPSTNGSLWNLYVEV